MRLLMTACAFSSTCSTTTLFAAICAADGPMNSDEELAAFGWQAYHLGEETSAAIVQADHAQYKTVTPGDFPGIKVLFDGRRVTDPELWAGTPRVVIGDVVA